MGNTQAAAKQAAGAGSRGLIARISRNALRFLIGLMLWTFLSCVYGGVRFRLDPEPPEANALNAFLLSPYLLINFWLRAESIYPDAPFPGALVSVVMARAEAGDVFSQSVLGEMYERGAGVARSWAKALLWWEKAAEQGDAFAQKRLEETYALGRGTQRNAEKADFWHARIADREEADRLFLLGLMHLAGSGAMRDARSSASYFTRSAELGNTEARFALGEMYEKGLGVPRDLNVARAWYKTACSADGEGAGCEAYRRLGGESGRGDEK